jgi:large subunit ribosomal protein L30
MIAIIRISGLVKVRQTSEETLFRLGLRRKYACVLINEKDTIRMGMLKIARDYTSYGTIERGVLIKLIEKRGQRIDKKEIKDAEKIVAELEKGKSLEEVGLKPFFRLHPPRGGLKSSKKFFPKGALGKSEGINKLIEKML